MAKRKAKVEGMKLVRVRVRRFLGIEDYETKLSPGLNVVTGKNGSGKTSFLKAILKALRGGKTDPWVIHRASDGSVGDGEGEPGVAEILVEMTGDMQVRRRITDEGTSVSVTKREADMNLPIPSPQKWLDGLVPAGSLNPVEFYSANAAERRRILLAAVSSRMAVGSARDRILNSVGDAWRGPTLMAALRTATEGLETVGLEEVSSIGDALSSMRTDAWRAKDRAAKTEAAERAKVPPGYSPEDVPSTKEVMKRLDAALATKEEARASKSLLARALEARNFKRDSVNDAETAVKDAHDRLANAKEALRQADIALAAAQEAANASVAAVEDESPIRAELEGIERRAAVRRAWDSAETFAKECRDSDHLVHALDAAIQDGVRVALPAALWDMMEDSPLKGLDVRMDGTAITVGGVDLDAMSEGERIRFALALARATAGSLRTIIVDGFEALDPGARAEFAKAASGDGFQYVVGEVGEGALRTESEA